DKGRDGKGGKEPLAKSDQQPEVDTEKGTARIYIGAGRAAGDRPRDLVGAITGEADIDSRQLGKIQISERFSVVEVPARLSTMIIEALSKGSIRGRKVVVRPDRDQ